MKDKYEIELPSEPTEAGIKEASERIIQGIKDELLAIKSSRKRMDVQRKKSLRDDLEFYKDSEGKEYLKKQAIERIKKENAVTNFREIGRGKSHETGTERAITIARGYDGEYVIKSVHTYEESSALTKQRYNMGYDMGRGKTTEAAFTDALMYSTKDNVNYKVLAKILPKKLAKRADHYTGIREELSRVGYSDNQHRYKLSEMYYADLRRFIQEGRFKEADKVVAEAESEVLKFERKKRIEEEAKVKAEEARKAQKEAEEKAEAEEAARSKTIFDEGELKGKPSGTKAQYKATAKFLHKKVILGVRTGKPYKPSLKEHKAELLARLDEAIEKAPEAGKEEGFVEFTIDKTKYKFSNDLLYLKITRQNAKSMDINVKAPKPTKAIVKGKPVMGKKESVGNLIPIKDKKGWFTDGNILVKGEKPKKAKKADMWGEGLAWKEVKEQTIAYPGKDAEFKYYTTKTSEVFEPIVSIDEIKKGDIISDDLIWGEVVGIEGTIKFGNKDIPAFKIKVLYGHEEGKISAMVKEQIVTIQRRIVKDSRAVSKEPIVKIGDKGPWAVFKSGDNYFAFDQDRFNVIRNRYPEAAYKMSKDEERLIAYDKGEPVGAIGKFREAPLSYKMAEEFGLDFMGMQTIYEMIGKGFIKIGSLLLVKRKF